jgi:leucyl aminopeptidase
MMKVSVTTILLGELDVDLLLVPVAEEAVSSVVAALVPVLGPSVERAAVDFAGKAGEAVVVYPEVGQVRRVALLGLGAEARIDAERLRTMAAEGAELVAKRKTETVGIALPTVKLDPEVVAQAVVEGFMLASYQFTRYKTATEPPFAGAQRLVLQALDNDKASRRGADRGRIIAESVATARDLVNLSPDEKTPVLLAKAIEKSARKHGYSAMVWDKALIQDEGMGGLLAVNRGSTEPPTFSVLTWEPENAVNERPIVLVGKGVVYDTGGLSLKPTDAMDTMKSDMSGAAAVVGTMEAIARLEWPLQVVGLIPATDNRPGENAYVNGDVLRLHGGKTVEVLNTDAEGRLLLADALSYAKTYKPELVIDLATLTGAAVIALGTVAAAVMTNETEGADERLGAMEAAGRRSGELVHRMPMFDDYNKQLESDVADLKNIGGREAGAITAAKFLEHFVDYPWLHLDIAGTAFLRQAKPYRPKGGTGFGVRLLLEFLRDYTRPRKR